MRDKLPDLTVMVGGASVAENTDKALLNPYGVIVVNPARHPEVNAELAEQFAVWLVEPETQQQIGAFGQERYGQPLFYPGVPE
jgi:tungstate transport system substrate-binding protein